MRCPHCNEKTANHDLWCVKCGKQTDIISKDLSALKSLDETWKKYKLVKGNNFPVGIFATLFGIIPMYLIIWVLNYLFIDMPKWQLMIISNLVWLLFLPILLVPFSAVCKKDTNKIELKDYFASFKKYFNYFMLSLITVIFYLAIFFICKGDPILNLVWLVLVVYWIAIIIPVPVIMERYNLNSFKALKLVYKQAGDIRWNIFLMAIVLVIANVMATLLLIVGLAITIPYTWFAIRDYVDKLIEYEVL